MEYAKLVMVRAFGNRPEAELAKGALEAAGISAMIQSDSVGGMRDHLAWSGEGFRVLVREEDQAAALEVLSSSASALDENADVDPQDDGAPRPN